MNFYHEQPQRAFWKPAVAARHVNDMTELWSPILLRKEERIATAGSCFAQHIGRRLRSIGAGYLDLEPAPSLLSDQETCQKFGYGVYSCRYGNIYTVRQLLQLARESLGQRSPEEIVWERGGRYFDALRAGVDPVGQATAEDVMISRRAHLGCVRRLWEELDTLVFTLGLTEGWESTSDGSVYSNAPGVVAGAYDSTRYRMRNFRYSEIMADFSEFISLLRSINPLAKLILTVSPVPLIATATDNHVLSATVYSKSTLRAVAGDLAQDFSDVFYFPSYELIAAHPTRGAFFEPDLRSVNQMGVDLVMRHFLANAFGDDGSSKTDEDDGVICDEEAILKAL